MVFRSLYDISVTQLKGFHFLAHPVYYYTRKHVIFTATCFSNVAVLGSLDVRLSVRPSVCPSVRLSVTLVIPDHIR